MNRRIIGIVAACVLTTSCSMDPFLVNPSALSEYVLSTAVIPDSLRSAFTVRSGTETIYGFHARQPQRKRIPPHTTIIYHHGNKGHLGEYWDRVEVLYQAGFDVVTYDYRGFGRSTGTTTEASLFADAAAVMEYVVADTTIDTNQLVAYGFSLGGVPALYQAVELGRARALITEAIFASGEALVQSGTKLDVPGRWLLEGSYNNVERMQRKRVPLLLLHGSQDELAGFADHAEPLFRSAPQPKLLIRVEGAYHDGIITTLGQQLYIDHLTSFILGS
ncbi:MAG: alpha/beta hydrolase [Candidatus Kapabacteria bacterium]|jgi:hypothetical protein|nr:alpha/beta hydrolase [Candidatus Kapabacteria bacterium]